MDAIGHVSSPRTEPIDDDWDAIVSTITLDGSRFTPDALVGLDAYSHVEVVFQFDRVEPEKVQLGARRPRNNPDWPEVGIFAQRAKNRPNRIGTCVCRVLGVAGLTLTVRGLDAIDGTPVLDLKPYMVEFGPREPVHQPPWSHELMAHYWDDAGAADVTEPLVGAVSCALTLTIGTPADIVLQVAAARRPHVVHDRLDVTNNGISRPSQEILAADQSRQHLVRAEPGLLTVSYTGTTGIAAPPRPERVTDPDRIVALRPSRYCPSDRLSGFALSHFGDRVGAADRVRAICAYVWRHISYDTAASAPGGDAIDTLTTGAGVCRDFAHLVVTLCRAVEVPARMVAVYAPGLSPMDFHAVVETAIDGHWWTWDATRLAPRPTLIRIATGRDAADVAFATTLSGQVELSTVELMAVAPAAIPLDDHEQLVALG